MRIMGVECFVVSFGPQDKRVCVFVELVELVSSWQGVDKALPLPDPVVQLPFLSAQKSCRDILATARVIAQSGQR